MQENPHIKKMKDSFRANIKSQCNFLTKIFFLWGGGLTQLQYINNILKIILVTMKNPFFKVYSKENTIRVIRTLQNQN